MINIAATVLLHGKVLGGTTTVSTPTSMVATSGQKLDLGKELTGSIGKMTTNL